MLKLEAAVIKKGDVQVEERDSLDANAFSLLGKLMDKKALYGNNLKAGHFAKINKGKLYYEIYGEGEPLLILHGNNEGIGSFTEQIGPLSKRFQVIAVDTRGHGNSTSNFEDDYSYDLFADDMIQLMDTLGLKKVHVLGWSDGGNTGLLMAIHYPERIKSLMTMGANVFPGEKAIDPSVIKIFQKRKEQYLSKTDSVSVNQLKITNLVLQEPHITKQQLLTIKLPVLIIAGENDVIREEHTRYIHAHIADSKMIIIKNADHYAPINTPKVFNEIVMDFLKFSTKVNNK